MKKGILILLMAVVGFGSTTVSAQSKGTKIGYAYGEYIVSLHPKRKEIESQITARGKQHEKLIQEKVLEFQEKYAAYEKGASMMTEIQRADKERELQSLNARIEQMQADAEGDLQKLQASLLQPILDEVQKAIDAVRDENSYAMILNASSAGISIVLSAPEEANTTNLILKKMGITPPKEETK